MSTTANDTTGKGVITRDAKVGQLVNAIVTGVGLAVVSFLTDLNFSDAPSFVATLAPVAVGLVTGWITTKFLPRYAKNR